MLVLLYFVMPILALVKKLSTRDLLFIGIGLFLYKWANCFFKFGYSVSEYIIFISYVLLGYVIFDRKLYKQIPFKIIIPMFILTTICVPFVYKYLLINKILKKYDILWYYFPITVLFQLSLLFYYLSCMNMKRI